MFLSPPGLVVIPLRVTRSVVRMVLWSWTFLVLALSKSPDRAPLQKQRSGPVYVWDPFTLHFSTKVAGPSTEVLVPVLVWAATHWVVDLDSCLASTVS